MPDPRWLNVNCWFVWPLHDHEMTSPPLAVERPLTSAQRLVVCVGSMRYVPFAIGAPPVIELKFAVNVVFVAGTVISWVCAPPSDHERKLNVVVPEVCGDVTPSVRIIPTTFRNPCGAVNGVPSSSSCRPVGFEASVMVA